MCNKMNAAEKASSIDSEGSNDSYGSFESKSHDSNNCLDSKDSNGQVSETMVSNKSVNKNSNDNDFDSVEWSNNNSSSEESEVETSDEYSNSQTDESFDESDSENHAIEELLDKYRDLKNSSSFRGQFTIAHMPKVIGRIPLCSLVNLDRRLFKEHWIAVYVSKNHREYVYDHEGKRPSNIEILQFLEKHTQSWTYNKNCHKKIRDMSKV